TIHLQVAVAVIGWIAVPESPAADDEPGMAGPVGVQREVATGRVGNGLERRRRPGIPEKQGCGVIVGTGELARRLAMQYENAILAAGAQHGRADVKTIGITRAPQADIEGSAVGAQAEPLVQHAA